jgi:hypothetical protein
MQVPVSEFDADARPTRISHERNEVAIRCLVGRIYPKLG